MSPLERGFRGVLGWSKNTPRPSATPLKRGTSAARFEDKLALLTTDEFNLAILSVPGFLPTMPPRVRKTRSRLPSLAESFVKKLSTADARLRRKVVRYAFWVVGTLFLYSLMVGTYNIPRIIRLEMQKSALVETNQRLLVNLMDNDRIRKMLESDRIYLEHIARTRFHMARPDETIYLYRGR